MRVELIYTPGCSSYKTVRETLETVIAEERLPIPVEMVEEVAEPNSPRIRINGKIIERHPSAHTLDCLRAVLCGHWKELSEGALHHV